MSSWQNASECDWITLKWNTKKKSHNLFTHPGVCCSSPPPWHVSEWLTVVFEASLLFKLILPSSLVIHASYEPFKRPRSAAASSKLDSWICRTGSLEPLASSCELPGVWKQFELSGEHFKCVESSNPLTVLIKSKLNRIVRGIIVDELEINLSPCQNMLQLEGVAITFALDLNDLYTPGFSRETKKDVLYGDLKTFELKAFI